MNELLSRTYAMQLACIIGAHERIRFGDIESHFPTASTSTLSARSDELVTGGLVTRHQYNEIPPRVEYELADDGHVLHERLAPLLEWASERQE